MADERGHRWGRGSDVTRGVGVHPSPQYPSPQEGNDGALTP